MKKILPFVVVGALYMAAFVSLTLPIRAIEENLPFQNHLFLLIWAVAAMALAVFKSRQEMKNRRETNHSQKIVGDAIVAGVVVYSGLALFLVLLGDLYRETLVTTPSDWKLFAFVLEGILLALGSSVVIWRTNGWSWGESHSEGDVEE